jgi:hypothetical protein
MQRVKPERIKGIKIKGVVRDSEKEKSFTFEFQPKNRDFREELEELRPRSQKIENGRHKYFRSAFRGAKVHLIYLNWESAKGLYKNSENNLPYEVLSEDGNLLYRQSIIERKEDIFNNLEKAAIEEGIKK